MNTYKTARNFVIPGIVLALAACGKKEDPAKAAGAGGPPPAMVSVITVAPEPVSNITELPGRIEAVRTAEVRARVGGIVQKRIFTEGGEVRAGQPLYQIDPVPFQAAVASAKAKIAQAEAKLVQAKQDLERVKPLLAEQAVSQKDVDDAVAQELSAKAALQGAKADLIKAQFDLDNTLITAPISGLIERSRYYEGRLVSAQTDLLTVVHQVDPMFVVVNVPESFILKRRRDIESKKIHHPGVYQLRGRLTMMDDTAYPHEGVLDLLEPGLRSETGSRQTRITFPNPDRTLLPGQFVKVRFTGDTKTDAVLIPQRAVLQGLQGPFVYVVGPDEKVQIRDVVASTWKGDQWMIDGGLNAGDRVVVNGLMMIGPGAPVKAVPWKATTAPATDPVPPTQKQG